MGIQINGQTNVISGLSAGGLPDGSITADDLASTLNLSSKTVTLPYGATGSGKVLQVSSSQKTDTQVFTSGSGGTFYDVTDMSVTITPLAASSNIFISGFLSCLCSGSNQGGIHIFRGSTEIGQAAAEGDRKRVHATFNANLDSGAMPSWSIGTIPFNFLDSPTYTLGNSITYKISISHFGANIWINRSSRHSASTNYDHLPTSIITVMEVAS